MTKVEKTIWVFFVIILIAVLTMISVLIFRGEGFGSGSTNDQSLFDSVGLTGSEKLYRKIEIAYEMADYDSAVSSIAEYLSDYPSGADLAGVNAIAADILFERGDSDNARIYITRVVSDDDATDADLALAVVVLGKMMKQSGTFNSVTLNYLEDAYLRAPADYRSDLALYLAYAYLYKCDYSTAIGYFEAAMGDESLIGMAEVYLAQSKYAEAIAEYENFFALYPSSPLFEEAKESYIETCFLYAEKLSTAGAADLSIEYYLKVVNQFRTDVKADEALFEIAEVYYENYSYENAILFYDMVLDNAVTDYDDDSIFEKGLVYYESGELSSALSQFRTLIEQYSSSPFAGQAEEWKDLIILEMQL